VKSFSEQSIDKGVAFEQNRWAPVFTAAQSGNQLNPVMFSIDSDEKRTVQAGRRRRTSEPGPEGRERADAPQRRQPGEGGSPRPPSGGGAGGCEARVGSATDATAGVLVGRGLFVGAAWACSSKVGNAWTGSPVSPESCISKTGAAQIASRITMMIPTSDMRGLPPEGNPGNPGPPAPLPDGGRGPPPPSGCLRWGASARSLPSGPGSLVRRRLPAWTVRFSSASMENMMG